MTPVHDGLDADLDHELLALVGGEEAGEPDLAQRLSQVLDRVDDLLHREPQRADRLARWCDGRAGAPELLPLRARARYQQAQIMAERGELLPALAMIAEARACWAFAGEALAAMRTDLGRMHVLDDLGRHQEAIHVGELLILEIDRLEDDTREDELPRLIRAHAVKNLGVAYGLVGRHTEAMQAYARAEADYLALGMQHETALPLANRGVELLALGRPAEALAAFQGAIDMFDEIGDRVFAAQCQGDAAQAHRQLGQVGEALGLLEQARTSLEEMGVETEAARLRLALAETYLAVGLWGEARDAAELAAGATARSGLVHDEGMAYFLLALAELALGRCEISRDHLARASVLFEQVEDRQYLARVRLARGEASARLGRLTEASVELEACARELVDGGWAVPLVGARLWQADLAVDPQEVAARLEGVRGLVATLDLPELTYEHELRVGRLCRTQGRHDEAEQHLRHAIEQLSRATGAIADHALLTAFRAGRARAHAELVGVLLDRGRPEDLLEASLVADESRARTLTDLLTQAAGRGPALAAAGRDLGEAFAELSDHYLVEQQAGSGSDLALLAERTDELERLVSTLRLRHLDQQAELVRGRRAAPPAERSSRTVTPTVAFHADSDGALVAFVHLAEGLVVRRLPDPLSRVHVLMDDLHDQWSRITIMLGLDLGHSRSLLRTARDTLQSLHAALMAPVEDLLTQVGERLCIVPDTRMGAVPFAALYDGSQHLLDRWAITVAPTLVPSGRSHPTSAAAATVVAVSDEFAPATDEEARRVASRLPGSTLLAGEEATVERFTRQVVGADLVHLACHGVHRPENPLFSRLRLHDRWMTSAEIVQLDLRGALVVLSACESGVHGRAAEPVGLGWAFLAAGAAGVLVSSWPVDDEATMVVMDSLYSWLAAGTPPDEALRRAQQHAADLQPHPYYWGAFSYLVRPHTLPEDRS